MKRCRLLVLAVVLMLLKLVVGGLYADGCFVWQEAADLTEPAQKAILCHRAGQETMILQVKYEGAAKDFAWIVPLPTKPEVTAIDAEKSPFAEISLYTQLRDRWGLRGVDKAGGDDDVVVLERKTVGVYDVAVLAATEADALGNWLNKNGYVFPRKHNNVLEHYTKKKWCYVAMRIDRKALQTDEVNKLRTGELQPIRFKFQTENMVYPLRISSVNAGETEILLYVLADAPMMIVGEHKGTGFSIEQNFFSQVRGCDDQDPAFGTYRKANGTELPLTWLALGMPATNELSLCKYRQTYKTEDMRDDLTFVMFDAEAYWRAVLAGDAARQNEWIRQQALSILAYYDPRAMRILARSTNEAARVAATSALNHASPRDVIQELATDRDVEVRTAVARNPRVPGNVLAELSKDSVLPVRECAAMNPSTPQESLRQLARDTALIRYVAMNPGITGDLLQELATNANFDVRSRVACNPWTPDDILLALAADKDARVRQSILALPVRQAKVLMLLAEDPDSAVRVLLAYYQWLSTETVTKLLEDKVPGVREALAKNSSLWERADWQGVSKCLADDKDSNVRMVIAANPRVGADILRKLAFDSCDAVRRVVADNQKLLPDLIRALAEDKDVEVRRKASMMETTPTDALRRLSSDEDPTVRGCVLRNRSTPAQVLDMMVNDKSEEIRTTLAASDRISPAALRRLANDASEEVKRVVAWNNRTPADALDALANDESAAVRRQVCGNTNVTVKILARLARDKALDIKWVVLRDARLPAETLRWFARDPESMGHGAGPEIAAHPNTPDDVLEMLAGSKDFYTRQHVAARRHVTTRVLRGLSKDGESGIRSTVASNETTPIDILRELSGDSHADVRRGVALNPTTPADLLSALASDKDASVANSAKEELEKPGRKSSWPNQPQR